MCVCLFVCLKKICYEKVRELIKMTTIGYDFWMEGGSARKREERGGTTEKIKVKKKKGESLFELIIKNNVWCYEK